MTASKNRIFLGRIGAAHGIRGEVRIATHTEDPLAIATYGPLDTDRPGLVVTIEHARLSKNVVIARLRGVSERDAAEKLNGAGLYIERARLPAIEDEDDFYHADLIGLEARLETGQIIGTVTAIPNYGAGDLIEVRALAGNDSFLYPFTRQVVPHIDIAGGYLTINLPRDAELGEEEPD